MQAQFCQQVALCTRAERLGGSQEGGGKPGSWLGWLLCLGHLSSHTSQPLDPLIGNVAAETLVPRPRAEQWALGDGAPRLHPRFPCDAGPRCPDPWLPAGRSVCRSVLGCAEWTVPQAAPSGAASASARRRRAQWGGLLGSAVVLMLGTGTGTPASLSASPRLTLTVERGRWAAWFLVLS